MRILIYVMLLFASGVVKAQLTDSFSDGDFTNNPSWSGDAGNFTVNAGQQLQLNATAAGSSFLSTTGYATSLDNTEWQFYIRLNFAPSNNNYARVYLVSDQSNLKGSLNGYYLQFGESGSNDAIELFRQSGTGSVSVARGTDGFIASAFTIRVKVTRNSSGLWSIYADAAAGNNFTLQATGTDATFNSSLFFGVLCTYTLSNVTNFFFDDFLWPHSTDVLPPTVIYVTASSANQLAVKFDEPVELNSAQNTANYTANNGLGNPSQAQRDASDFSIVNLTFTGSFQPGLQYTLITSGVSDLNGNTMTVPQSFPFMYNPPVLPQQFDVVITEIMADPDPPVQLPNSEYLEIFNRSNHTFNLLNWTLTAGSTTKVFGNQNIGPGQFLIICTPAAEPALSAFGFTAPILTSSTTLTNSGTKLILKDNNGLTLDSVSYSDSWYRDPQKADGGWSLERINPDFTCPNPLNWMASADPRGGSPGSLNSVDGPFADNEPPRLLRAYLTAADKVIALFSEPLASADLLNVLNYTISNGLGNPLFANLLSNTEVELTLSSAVLPSVIYTLTVSQTITDCPGNFLAANSARFALDEIPAVSDILINEILYRPLDSGAEFVEIFNRSDKIIDLSKIRIAGVNADNTLQTQYALSNLPYLFFPGDYMVLSKSSDAVKSNYFTPNPDNFITLSSFISLSDGGDQFALLTNSGIRIDQLRYSPSWQFALLNDDKGVSLERISINRPTQDSTNWHSAAEPAGFATPAYKNSQATEVTTTDGELTISPEIFSPDNDGSHDVVFFNYNFSSPGFIANLKIFDARGRQVIHLVKNQLLGTEGSFAWDGITADRQKASIGIYVAWLEVFNADGTIKKFKRQFVLASKL